MIDLMHKDHLHNRSNRFKTPILFITFNRPETTIRVFQSIRLCKPNRLYIASDGPRTNREGEAETIKALRDQVMQAIDWDCEIQTLFRDKNLGCKYGVSGAISWFFENEEKGIILEDDCMPSNSFFRFCEELLEKYSGDERVGQISGFNHGFYQADLKYDYFFTRYPSIWGWATWSNRWKNYSNDLKYFDEFNKYRQLELIFSGKEIQQKMRLLLKARKDEIDTWDYPWSFTLYKNNQLSVIPRENLVINLGFGRDATHTSGYNPFSKTVIHEINGIIKHPPYIVQLIDYDRNIFKNYSMKNRIMDKLFK